VHGGYPKLSASCDAELDGRGHFAATRQLCRFDCEESGTYSAAMRSWSRFDAS
jgi:hypothetical protein